MTRHVLILTSGQLAAVRSAMRLAARDDAASHMSDAAAAVYRTRQVTAAAWSAVERTAAAFNQPQQRSVSPRPHRVAPV
jgi:hypothetical protein